MTNDCKVGAVLFHSDEMMTLGSGGVFYACMPAPHQVGDCWSHVIYAAHHQ